MRTGHLHEEIVKDEIRDFLKRHDTQNFENVELEVADIGLVSRSTKSYSAASIDGLVSVTKADGTSTVVGLEVKTKVTHSSIAVTTKRLAKNSQSSTSSTSNAVERVQWAQLKKRSDVEKAHAIQCLHHASCLDLSEVWLVYSAPWKGGIMKVFCISFTQSERRQHLRSIDNLCQLNAWIRTPKKISMTHDCGLCDRTKDRAKLCDSMYARGVLRSCLARGEAYRQYILSTYSVDEEKTTIKLPKVLESLKPVDIVAWNK